jgi:hypothetical protein
MPAEEPKKKSGISTPAKVVAISAALILLGLGLCSGGGFSLEGTSSTAAQIGTLAFLAGVAGFVVGVLWWLIYIISKK